MMLPLLAFVFGSLVIAAAALVLMPKPARGHRPPPRRARRAAGRRRDGRKPRLQSLIAFFKRVGEKAPRSTKEMGIPAAAPGPGRLPAAAKR